MISAHELASFKCRESIGALCLCDKSDVLAIDKACLGAATDTLIKAHKYQRLGEYVKISIIRTQQ
jgi:hypothetical protein